MITTTRRAEPDPRSVRSKGRRQRRCALFAALLAFILPQPCFAVGAVRGGAVPLPSDEITPAERARIEAAIAANVASLQRSHRLGLPIAHGEAPTISLLWPLELVLGHPEPAARTGINFVDHDPAFPDHVQGYMCGARSYDQANGYNHQGTDITSYPFAWRKMDNEEVVVVAAAAGTIVLKEDGQFDRNCTLETQSWNA